MHKSGRSPNVRRAAKIGGVKLAVEFTSEVLDMSHFQTQLNFSEVGKWIAMFCDLRVHVRRIMSPKVFGLGSL